MEYNTQGLNNLCEAVIIQACKDYKKALKDNDINEIELIEKFFHSPNYDLFINGNIDPDYLIREIRNRANIKDLTEFKRRQKTGKTNIKSRSKYSERFVY